MSNHSNRPDGGELLARTLAAAGVEQVFALHGGHLEAFWQACLRHGLRLTDFRHESAAGHAADAYARCTGRLGVCTTRLDFPLVCLAAHAITAFIFSAVPSIPGLIR